MKGSLIVFAKDSQLSEVKTRLANQTNRKFAREFYQHSLKAVFETIQKAKEKSRVAIDLYCALPEKKSVRNKRWQDLGVQPVWTTSHRLDISLSYIYQLFIKQSNFVIIIGSDSPQISSDELIAVINGINQLEVNQCLVGPSLDGGFYLFASQAEVNADIWLNIKYSKSNTLNQLIKVLKQNNLKIKLLEPQIDIDTLENIDTLKSILEAISKSNQINAAQRKLLNWLNNQKN